MNKLFSPPLALALTVVLSFVLDKWFPIITFPLDAFVTTGIVLIIIGLALAAWTLQLFEKHSTTVKPWGAPSHLITEGFYRWSRNPIYVGYIMAAAGWSFLLSSLSAFLPIIGLWWILDNKVIPVEEKNLETAFAERYADYSSKVKRWISLPRRGGQQQ